MYDTSIDSVLSYEWLSVEVEFLFHYIPFCRIEQQMSTPELTTTQSAEAADVATAVLTTVSNTTGRQIDELPALFDVVDPDALNSVFRSPGRGSPRTSVHLTFTFAGCRVDVDVDAVTAIPITDAQSGSVSTRRGN